MSSELLSSKTVIYEGKPNLRGIQPAATSVAGAIGITERGPIGKPTLVTSQEEFQNIFGGFTANSELALAVKGFFENGGSQLWVVRTVHYTNIANPNTATASSAYGYIKASGVFVPATVVGSDSPFFSLNSGDKIAVSVNGEPELEAIFEGEPATVHSNDAGTFSLNVGDTLSIRLEDGREQTITFESNQFENISAATDVEIAAEINTQLLGGKAVKTDSPSGIVIASDIKGQASQLQVIGGSANVVLGFSEDPQYGTGSVININRVTMEEVKGAVELLDNRLVVDRDVEGRLRISVNTDDPNTSLQVGGDTSEAFGFDYEYHEGAEASDVDVFSVGAKDPGSHGNRISVEIAAPVSGNYDYADLVVKVDGVVKERFRDVSIDQSDPRYVVDIVNSERVGSSYIGLIDMRSSDVSEISEQVVQLGFGEDGLYGLDDLDFIGSEISKAGLHAFDSIQDLSLIMIPGRATPAVHDAILNYCENVRDGLVFAVLDPPSDLSAVAVKDYVVSLAGLMNKSEFGAIYWPWLEIINPSRNVFGSEETIAVPPSGIVCGIYSRNDSATPGGLYQPPAGVEAGRVFGVVGFNSPDVLEEAKRDIVYPARINPITTTPGNPIYIDGSRTLKSNGQFPYVAEKRGVVFIKQSLKSGLEFARHRNNDTRLRAEVFRTIKAFLMVQMNNGAFRYTEPEKAFQIEISDDPLDVMNHQLRGKVLLATNKAVDWVVIEIGQDLRDLGVE